MSSGITGNRHMGSSMKKKQAYVNEWKMRARRKVMPGYPIEKSFETREEIESYLNCDRITCLLCGKTFKELCAHLSVHGTNADDYKEKYGIPFGAGLTCITTNAKHVKHGYLMVEQGVFKPPSGAEMIEILRNKRSPRLKPRYARDEAAARIRLCITQRAFKEEHYWRVLAIAENDLLHPTDVCRANRGELPSIGLFHVFKGKNEQFQQKYNEIIDKLPLKDKLRHGVAPPEYIDKIRELKAQRKSNKDIAKLLGLHEGTIEKNCKKYGIKKPLPATCGKGLHSYPGINKPCLQCRATYELERKQMKARMLK